MAKNEWKALVPAGTEKPVNSGPKNKNVSKREAARKKSNVPQQSH
jgi:hypothetical protein